MSQISLKRRKFLILSASGAVVGGLSWLFFRPRPLRCPELLEPAPKGGVFNRREKLTVTATMECLLPSEPESPGALDVNAMAYLEKTLTAPQMAQKLNDMLLGARRLDDFARGFGVCNFFELQSKEKQNQVLKVFQRNKANRAWMTLLLGFSLEAYLGDPVYGGNPKGLVWSWLNFVPGFPRPKTLGAGLLNG